MGLFDRFKKQNTQADAKTETVEKKAEAVAETVEEKAEAVEAVAEAVEEKAEAYEATAEAAEKKAEAMENGERRFTLMVEECHKINEDTEAIIVGNLKGTIRKGDTVYVIHPSGRVGITKVQDLEVGPGRATEEATDEKVALTLTDIKDKNVVPRFTVLTSIRPLPYGEEINKDTKVENPWLLGLSMDYAQWVQDNNYLNILIFVICHTNFVVPVSVTPNPNGGNEPLLRFPSLQNPADRTQNVFPVFTDDAALDKWEGIFDENHPKNTTNLKFPEILSICNGTGMVINPFGPTPILLSPQQISQIVNMEGYKQEFGAKEGENVQKAPMEQGANVMVGVPKENEEIRMIKEAIVAFAQQTAEIKRVDFLLKVDIKQERAYMCVVDCEEELAPTLFNSIYQAAAPYFKEVQRMEFLLHGKSKIAVDAVSEKSVIYQV
ncbi:MAG: enhanced serine sensitivity protein SseB C-terminal domain-containing protein [Lachnospiraceae bacterium]|nr:enhanced serine sensitivity protein SseB C-terminal domain-containing protein [Lachnospiraceae bacterium]